MAQAQIQTKTKRKILNIPLPAKLFWEVERVAQEESKTKAEFAREAVMQCLNSRKRWKEIRQWGSAAAKRLGIKNEDDVEKLLDEIK